MKCKVCGQRFRLTKENVYMVREMLSVGEAFGRVAKVFDAMDCPRCGCQVLLQVRKAPFNPNLANDG